MGKLTKVGNVSYNQVVGFMTAVESGFRSALD